MALNHFGIKEVADVRFYTPGTIKVDESGAIVPVTGNSLPDYLLEFTTLKVSNLEFTAEQSEARGGKGNAPLIIWDYGREVNVTLEDALLSVECMRQIFGAKAGKTITIGAQTFPGNVAVVGVTFARDQETGEDHLFTFFIPNAKIGSEITLTMEAEGDPTVFSMNLRAMRASKSDDTMVALIPCDEAYTGTNVLDEVVGTATEYCQATFIFADSTVETYKVSKGTELTVPENTENYKWNNVEGTTVTVNNNVIYDEAENV